MTNASAPELFDLAAQMEDHDVVPNTTSFNLVLKAMYKAKETIVHAHGQTPGVAHMLVPILPHVLHSLPLLHHIDSEDSAAEIDLGSNIFELIFSSPGIYFEFGLDSFEIDVPFGVNTTSACNVFPKLTISAFNGFLHLLLPSSTVTFMSDWIFSGEPAPGLATTGAGHGLTSFAPLKLDFLPLSKPRTKITSSPLAEYGAAFRLEMNCCWSLKNTSVSMFARKTAIWPTSIPDSLIADFHLVSRNAFRGSGKFLL
ncbi:pentatricopeptide repeat-containing protein [Quercus suber]|uniref:Pentatricopeptide repeat-containing protein n=1 Tax=Quercus suber TaxID=58331 RepID=A0AAW0J409_QUESU